MRLVFLVMSIAGLGACAGPTRLPPVENPVPLGIDDTCGAGGYRGIIGSDAFVLQRGFRPGDIRIIQPGTVGSDEYIPTRLSFHIGPANEIRYITCG